MTDRLDRIEAILSNVAERQDRFQQQLERVEQQQDRTQQQIDSNARAIEANSAAIEAGRNDLRTTQQIVDSNARAIEANSAESAQGRQETNAVREDLRSATQMILDLGEFLGNQFDRLERQFEQDRAERLALSADVRSLVEALRERFRSNGHS